MSLKRIEYQFIRRIFVSLFRLRYFSWLQSDVCFTGFRIIANQIKKKEKKKKDYKHLFVDQAWAELVAHVREREEQWDRTRNSRQLR